MSAAAAVGGISAAPGVNIIPFDELNSYKGKYVYYTSPFYDRKGETFPQLVQHAKIVSADTERVVVTDVSTRDAEGKYIHDLPSDDEFTIKKEQRRVFYENDPDIQGYMNMAIKIADASRKFKTAGGARKLYRRRRRSTRRRRSVRRRKSHRRRA